MYAELGVHVGNVGFGRAVRNIERLSEARGVLGVDSEPIPHLYSAGKVVEANSTDVDGVTGATITSKAFFAAVQNAIAKA